MVEKNNNVIVFDGVQYKISPTDWNLQQQILSRATVVKDDKAPEKLTDIVVQRLIGHANVVYYNCETNAWNTNKYNGYEITYHKVDAECVKKFKSVMERDAKFSQHYEFAAPVIMTICRISYPGSAEPISYPHYDKTGAVIGNIIVKNKATGQYELYCKSWVGVFDYYYPMVAVHFGVFKFVYNGAWESDFRAALIAAHTR